MVTFEIGVSFKRIIRVKVDPSMLEGILLNIKNYRGNSMVHGL